MYKKITAAVSTEIIRPRYLYHYIGLSRTTIWRLEKEGKFVPRIRLSQNTVGYRKTDIDNWIEDRIEIIKSKKEGEK